MKRILLSDVAHAQQANAALRAALRAHFEGLAPPPANLGDLLSSVESCYNSLKNKIDSVEHCERLLQGIDWPAFWKLQDQDPPQNYPFMTIADGLLSINLNSENGLSFLFVTFEHFARCIKNLSDVYSVLLNDLWMLGLSGAAINLRNVGTRVRQRNAQHGVIGLVDPILGNDASWWWAASNIRNDSQHLDATSILTIPVGRGSTDPPYLDSRLFPRANMFARRVDQFCPWIKDQAFQFVESISQILANSPNL